MSKKEEKAYEYSKIVSNRNQMIKDFVECAFMVGWDCSLRNQWVNTKDKLPKELEKVLLASLYEGEMLYSVGYMFNGKWVTPNNKPFAWMPIPSFDEILEANKDVLERLKDK